MAKKNELDDILLELKKDITRIVDAKITEEVKEVYREEVEYMYDEYSPTMYKRRGTDGGFNDERNWDIDINLNKNGVELTLTNETKTVDDNSPYRLDEIIEDGDKYTWERSEIYKEKTARPVYQRTEERIQDEQIIENILESQLRGLGYDIK